MKAFGDRVLDCEMAATVVYQRTIQCLNTNRGGCKNQHWKELLLTAKLLMANDHGDEMGILSEHWSQNKHIECVFLLTKSLRVWWISEAAASILDLTGLGTILKGPLGSNICDANYGKTAPSFIFSPVGVNCIWRKITGHPLTCCSLEWKRLWWESKYWE